jgi:HEAT repeat protein
MLGERDEVRIDGAANRWAWIDAGTTDPGNEAAAALGSYGDVAVDALLAAYDSASSNEVRHDALHALALTRSPRALPLLFDALDDPTWELRARAAWGLGVLVEPRATDALVRAVGDENWRVRYEAVWSLGHIADEKSAAALRDALSDGRWEVRREAARALGILADAGAVSALEAAASDVHREVREQATWALARIRPAAHREPASSRSYARTFAVRGGGVLRIEADVADLVLLSGDGDQVSAQVRVDCFSGPCDAVLAKYAVAYRDDNSTLTLASGFTGDRPSQREVQVSGRRIFVDDDVAATLTITIPRGLPVRVDLLHGDVELRGLERGLDARVGMGTLEGELAASTLSRVALASDVGTVRLEGVGTQAQRRENGVGDRVEWTAGSGRASVDVAVGVGSARLVLE